MAAISISVQAQTPLLQRVIRERALEAGLLRVVARETDRTLRDHFRGLTATRRNKMGFPSRGFWEAVGRSVQQPVYRGVTSATITINHPALALRRYGGVVRGRPWLTIPLSSEAYRSPRARDMRDLFFMRTRSSGRERLFLARKSGKGRLPIVHWMLTPSTRHKADPTVMPSKQVLQANAERRRDAFVRRLLQQ